jgi:hypothetical protein
MQTKVAKLLVIFVVLFSLRGFSQTATPKSKHPKMDAYYPPKPDADTNKTVTTEPTQTPISTQPTTTTTTAPPVTTTSVVTTPPVVTLPPPVATTPTTTTVTAQVAAPAKVQTKPPPPSPYLDTRTGSSTPQYDTWDKNNNGAGSVTTSPK